MVRGERLLITLTTGTLGYVSQNKNKIISIYIFREKFPPMMRIVRKMYIEFLIAYVCI